MSRGQTVSRSGEEPIIDPGLFDEALHSQLKWLREVIGLQTAWFSGLMALQSECWRNWSTGSQLLPAWMVWHNGTEQLA